MVSVGQSVTINSPFTGQIHSYSHSHGFWSWTSEQCNHCLSALNCVPPGPNTMSLMAPYWSIGVGLHVVSVVRGLSAGTPIRKMSSCSIMIITLTQITLGLRGEIMGALSCFKLFTTI